MNIIKNTRLFVLSIIIALSSCIESEDLMTASVKTGGLVDATTALQYKPGSTQSVDVEVFIFKGPTVNAINIYKRFTHITNSSGNVAVSESDEVLLKSIPLSDDNSIDSILVVDSFTWAELSQGIPQLPDGYNVPQVAATAKVGDYFTLSYCAALADGREVRNNPTTSIVVANFFAGYYTSNLKYFHPTLGGTYPDDPYFEDNFLKELFTVSNADCSTFFALWDDAIMDIKVEADNTVTFNVKNFSYIVKEGDPYDLTNRSHYDPITKTIYLYYYYESAGGYRVFWETLSPNAF